MTAQLPAKCPDAPRSRGMTLVEMVVSTVLVGVMLVAALNTVGAARMGQRKACDSRRGQQLARELMSEILLQEYADAAVITSLRTEILINGGNLAVPLGPEPGEDTGNRSRFDDIDDYHGWSASPPRERDGAVMSHLTDWRREVVVQYVKEDEVATLRDEDEGAKRITVTVSYDDLPVAELVVLRTLGPPPTEACCLGDGICIDMAPDVCTSLGGEAQGTGTSCILTSCAGVLELIAHWTFDEDAGDTITDEVSGLVGAIHGAQWKDGQFGDALEFDGDNDYVEIPHTDGFLLDDGTVSIWFEADSLPSRAGLVSKDSMFYDTGGHLLIYTEYSTLKVRLQSVSATYYLIAPTTLGRDKWYHVALTFGSEGMKLYLNGALKAADPYTGGLGTTSGGSGNHEPFALGANNWASDDLVITPLQGYYEGKLDDFRIYSYALSADEVFALSNGEDP